MQQHNEQVQTPDEDNLHNYLLFTLEDELYGSLLLTVREVIKLNSIKAVPFMVAHFKGVINLRGQIVSVVDLRTKFGLKPQKDNGGLILIVETKNGLLGAIIDDVVAVQKFKAEDIDQNPALETKIPVQFFSGVAKLNDRLVNLIDISGCLSFEDLRMVKTNREAA